jgi:hypothetical protein
VAAGAPAEERRRAGRRIAERLGRIEADALRDAVVTAGPDAPAPLPPPAVAAPSAAPREPPAVAAAAPALRTRVAVAVVDDSPGDLDELEAAVLLEIRSALRGRAPEEITRLVPGPSDNALRSLVARGAVVRRGARYFPA